MTGEYAAPARGWCLGAAIKANPSRGGGAKLRASINHERWPGCRTAWGQALVVEGREPHPYRERSGDSLPYSSLFIVNPHQFIVWHFKLS